MISDKFSLLTKSAREIIIPANYKHESALSDFMQRHGAEFEYYNPRINDGNFLKVSHKLKPNERYLSKVWAINSDEVITRSEALELFAVNQVLLTGIRAVTLFYEQYFDLFIKDKYFLSFDRMTQLVNHNEDSVEPAIRRNSYSHLNNFGLICYDPDFNDNCCLLGLCLA